MAKATERIFLPLIQKTLPEIVDLNLPVEGVFHNLAFISIDKRYPGHARKVMHALWGLGQMMFTKIILIFDREVDVQDLGQVLWRLGNNVDPAPGRGVRRMGRWTPWTTPRRCPTTAARWGSTPPASGWRRALPGTGRR